MSLTCTPYTRRTRYHWRDRLLHVYGPLFSKCKWRCKYIQPRLVFYIFSQFLQECESNVETNKRQVLIVLEICHSLFICLFVCCSFQHQFLFLSVFLSLVQMCLLMNVCTYRFCVMELRHIEFDGDSFFRCICIHLNSWVTNYIQMVFFSLAPYFGRFCF